MSLEQVLASPDKMARLEIIPGSLYDNLFLLGWAVGKRCNFACSYCSKEFHDRTSPHRSFDDMRGLWNNVKRQIVPRKMSAAIEFTGGEPTLNPDFLDFVRYLDLTQRPALQVMGVTTNGTESLAYYEQLTQHLDWITFSTHFEWWDENSFMTTLLDLKRAMAKRQRQTGLSVNLMYETWSLPELEKIKPILQAEMINSLPMMVFNEYGSKGIRNKKSQPFDYRAYLLDRDGVEPAPAASAAAPSTPSPPSTDDLLMEHSFDVDQPDMRLMLVDGQSVAVHSQVIINTHLNKFPGWRCNAGADRIFVNTDGIVYGGMCKAVQLGDMLSDFELFSEPVTCDGRECFCMSDVRIKKWKQSRTAADESPPPSQ